MDDIELLREYALRRSEQAFAALVSRHIDLVYSVALRHVGNHHQAEEITQAVFVILARKAGSLSPRTVLPGWLFRTARLTAANYLRTEMRRARREQEACMQSSPNENPDNVWQEVAPLLNDAIADLSETDRNAIVLRFLQGKDYKQVAAALGGSEEAAQMRVSRALEKLRKLFAKRGVAVPAALLGGLMAAHGTCAAPLGLAASVTAAALPGATLTASTFVLVKETLKVMAWTKVKCAVGAGVVVLLAYQYHQNTLQAQQVAAAREDLSARTEAAAAQESRITELEQQAAAIVETRREQEQQLARLRARRKNAAQGAPSQAAASSSTTLLQAALLDPTARAGLREGLVSAARTRWKPLVKELNLNAEDARKLCEIHGDWGMRDLETVSAFTAGKITAEAAMQAAEQSEQETANQARLLLGEQGLEKLKECNRSFPARALVGQFEKQLGVFGIDGLQRKLLAEVIDAEPFEITSGLAGDYTVREIVLPGELDRRFAQQQEANQRILQKAAEFLSADQLNSLGVMQRCNLSARKMTVLQVLRKL